MKSLSPEKKRIIRIILLVVLIILVIWALPSITLPSNTPEPALTIYEVNSSDEELLYFTMIDVGQGDAFLLSSGGQTSLVDCGPPEGRNSILGYLKEQNISKIDYFFGTHPHDDHLGSMHYVINEIEIGTIILPEVTLNVSNWYIDLMEELADDNYNVQLATVGNRYSLGDATIEIIGPLSEPTENLNNYSLVLKVSYGEMNILMMGDAETPVEKELLSSNVNLEAEILKVGHHGSNTSSSVNFLKAVNAEYAFISCKVGNRYKHPSKNTMEHLEENGVKVYRTDECGTVTAVISKSSIIINSTLGDYLSGTELEEKIND